MKKIRLTTDSAPAFLSWLDSSDDVHLKELLGFPRYRAVIEHSTAWGSPVT